MIAHHSGDRAMKKAILFLGMFLLTAEALLSERCYYDASQYDWVKKDYSTDFGKLVVQVPRGVFKPRSEEDLQKFIIWANEHDVRVACRGQGHSTDGQTLCENGIVIDLQDMPKTMEFTPGNDAVIVSGHATWKEVLDFTLPHRWTVPVLTDYLQLSVAGTLSIGGLGGSSFKRGSQADNVLALRVLTFDGRILDNEEILDAALCGLGQMGIILQATLSLVESKENVHCRLFYYRDAETFLKDQYALYAKGEIDHLKGFIHRRDGILYHVIEAAAFHDKTFAESEMFEGLSPDKVEEKNVPYLDFVNEVAHFAEMLSKEDKWHVPHPWYGVLLPEDQIAEHLKLALESPFLTGSEPILLFPLNTEHLRRPFFIRPQGKTVYLLSLLYNCSFLADAHIDFAKVIEHNHTLYLDAAKRGGCLYLSRGTEEAHFGKMWPAFSRMKMQFDPHRIRS
jgi:cytokinin dehydrogenase